MKRVIALCLALVIMAGLMSVSAGAAGEVKSFSDLPESHWAYDAVMDMVKKGMFNGTSDPVNGVGTFSPNKAMTKGEFLAVICRYYYPDEIYTPAAGLPWWDPYLTIAMRHELVRLVDYIDCNEAITRGEMVTLIDILMTELGTPLEKMYLDHIPDWEEMTGNTESYTTYESLANRVRRCMGEGLINGVDEAGTFDADGTLTRAQAATVVYRLIDPKNRLQEKQYTNPTPECGEDMHWFWNKDVECIIPATETQDGLYRVCCANCPYSFEVTLEAHKHKGGSITERTECKNVFWSERKCAIKTDVLYTSDGEMNAVTVTCAAAVPVLNASNVASKAEAEHCFNGWQIVSLPECGVEGRMEKVCSKCGTTYVKIIPMHSSPEATLDIRNSYGYGEGQMDYRDEIYYYSMRPEPQSDMSSVDAIRSALNGYVGRYYTLRFFDDGISTNYEDRGQGGIIKKHEDGRYGMNIFGWSKNSLGLTSVIMEGMLYLCADREVAYALWHVVDFMHNNGPDATTAEKIESFGFKTSNETSTSIELSMKGVHILWEWGGDINGNNFWFSAAE